MASPRERTAGEVAGIYLDLHPTEVCEVLDDQDVDEVAGLVEALSTPRACMVLENLSEHQGAACLERLAPEVLARVVSALDPARAALLVSRLDPAEREARLAALDPALAGELRDIMAFPADSAGHLMDTRVSTFRPAARVRDVLARLRREGAERATEVLVTDASGKLLGLLDVATVALAAPGTRLETLVTAAPPRVAALAPREDVVSALTGLGVKSLPVVDPREILLGVIRHEAVIQAVREHATADLAALVGASRDELALSPAMFAVKKRLPWLNVNLLTAFLAASVVGMFESTIAQFTALAVLLPVVAGQSGNTGAQALAVVIRGLALREIRTRHWAQVLVKEALVGVVNGVAIAVVTTAAVLLWSRSLGLGLVIFIAMILSMAIASVSGAAIPLVLARLKQDPAQSGSIILTTVTDVMGFLSFLGLAAIFSSLL